MDRDFYCDSDFRTACSVINEVDLYLGPEGGFSHAAAALNKKAVIYFGGWSNPQTMGYSFHKNIYVDTEESPCGAKGYLCNHCEKCRESISIEKMIRAIESQFD